MIVVVSLLYGFLRSEEVSFRLEFNPFLTPFFKLGITFQRYRLGDDVVEDELMIGLFIINVGISFIKTIEDLPNEEE